MDTEEMTNDEQQNLRKGASFVFENGEWKRVDKARDKAEASYNAVLADLNLLMKEKGKAAEEFATVATSEKVFEDHFNKLSEEINPIVGRVNDDLQAGRLFVFSDDKMKTVEANRKFIQIVLSPRKDYADVIRDPYLLFEGYPKSGKVRITQSNSENAGETLSIDSVTPTILMTSVLSFLRNAAGKPQYAMGA